MCQIKNCPAFLQLLGNADVKTTPRLVWKRFLVREWFVSHRPDVRSLRQQEEADRWHGGKRRWNVQAKFYWTAEVSSHWNLIVDLSCTRCLHLTHAYFTVLWRLRWESATLSTPCQCKSSSNRPILLPASRCVSLTLTSKIQIHGISLSLKATLGLREQPIQNNFGHGIQNSRTVELLYSEKADAFSEDNPHFVIGVGSKDSPFLVSKTALKSKGSLISQSKIKYDL